VLYTADFDATAVRRRANKRRRRRAERRRRVSRLETDPTIAAHAPLVTRRHADWRHHIRDRSAAGPTRIRPDKITSRVYSARCVATDFRDCEKQTVADCWNACAPELGIAWILPWIGLDWTGWVGWLWPRYYWSPQQLNSTLLIAVRTQQMHTSSNKQTGLELEVNKMFRVNKYSRITFVVWNYSPIAERSWWEAQDYVGLYDFADFAVSIELWFMNL